MFPSSQRSQMLEYSRVIKHLGRLFTSSYRTKIQHEGAKEVESWCCPIRASKSTYS